MARKFDMSKRRKTTARKIAKKGLAAKQDLRDLYRQAGGFEYDDVPQGVGPPFRRKKLAAYRASVRKAAI
jgi:hypothetical protein